MDCSPLQQSDFTHFFCDPASYVATHQAGGTSLKALKDFDFSSGAAPFGVFCACPHYTATERNETQMSMGINPKQFISRVRA